jgi:signal transduction histidine kinase
MEHLGNAIKYTPSGGRVDVRLATEGALARISVTDTGIGIDAGLLPHVFEKFRQADWRTAGTRGGLGLGLAIVRQLVEMHGGTVEAHSADPAAARPSSSRCRRSTKPLGPPARTELPSTPRSGAW